MRQFALSLNPQASRPITTLDGGWYALFDTGADFPVTYLNDTILREMFDARLVLKAKKLKALANKEVTGNIYVLPIFRVGELIYPWLPVFVPDFISRGSEQKHSIHFILTASMFADLRVDFGFRGHTVSITVPDGEDIVRHSKEMINGEKVVFSGISS